MFVRSSAPRPPTPSAAPKSPINSDFICAKAAEIEPKWKLVPPPRCHRNTSPAGKIGQQGERTGQIYVPFSAIIKFYITELITVMTVTAPRSEGVRFGTFTVRSSGAEFRAFCGQNDCRYRVHEWSKMPPSHEGLWKKCLPRASNTARGP